MLRDLATVHVSPSMLDKLKYKCYRYQSRKLNELSINDAMIFHQDNFLLFVAGLTFTGKIPTPTFFFGGQTGNRESMLLFHKLTEKSS